jgi:hypothetical protein
LIRTTSDAEIAHRLHLGEGTVETHVARVLTKLGVRDRLQAVVFLYTSGLIGRSGCPSVLVGVGLRGCARCRDELVPAGGKWW